MLSATAGLFVPVNAHAQKRLRIGALIIVPLDWLAAHPVWIAFLGALRTYGWNEGNNLEIIMRGTGGDQRKVPAAADELMSTGVELLLAFDTPSTEALLQRTRTVPIVFAPIADPVAAGLVSSLARPGGNATGLSNDLTDLNIKYIEFSRELVPDLRRLAVMFNPENQGSASGLHRMKTLAPTFGIEVVPTPVATLEQLEPALAALARERPQVVVVHPAQPISLHTARIAEFAIRHGIAPIGNVSNQVLEGGCLFAYGADPAESFRRVAYYVDRILRGTAPRDLPVELTKLRLTINLATARALNVAVPASLLVRADEVIR
ncbi:MAG: ABC transporter substrate-binding protein [Alphaproteobacteria bacterium]|nr:ABC transporter substrate-binding protein [Alphaproteobacteria bacterium]